MAGYLVNQLLTMFRSMMESIKEQYLGTPEELSNKVRNGGVVQSPRAVETLI